MDQKIEEPKLESVTGEAAPAPAPVDQNVNYSCSPGLGVFLGGLHCSIAISSYQSGKFYLVGGKPDGGLGIYERFFRKAMGIYTAPNKLILATLFQIIRFENALRGEQMINNTYDACFVPRTTHVTGVLDAHDLGVNKEGRIIFVNTRYNCLATTSTSQSFTPIWKPPFISKIVDEDRCHLNGLAMVKGRARFVTAVSKSDTIDGWRDRRSDGGIVMDVADNEIICEGLSMPHSPRWHDDKLWVCNSGTGELGWVEPAPKGKGKFHPLCFCPGFVRGLAIHDKYAFVGLSKPRYERFEGLALDQKLKNADSEPWCGVQIIDLSTGNVVQWFRMDGAVAELYDVNVVIGFNQPMVIGFENDDVLSFITHDELESK